MFRHRHVRRALVVLAMLLPPSAAQAINWLPDRDVRTYCRQFLTRPTSPSGTVCLAWTQGFLEGMRAVKPPEGSEMRSASAGDDDARSAPAHEQAERVAAFIAEFGPPARAGVCLPRRPDVEDITRVVARGIVYGNGDLDAEATAALRERYPCNVSDAGEAGGADSAT